MPSSSDYRNTTSTLSAPAPQQPASALPAEGFQFARPYAHTPVWAHSAVTAAFIATVEESADASAPSPDSTAPSPDIAAPSPDTTVSSADTAQQPQQATDQRAETESAPSSINDLLSTSGRTSTADLFRQPLKPQDYRASSAFVQKVVSQLLETVDRRRPFGHLRSFVTPDIMDIVEQFSSHRSRAIMELAGPSLTTPGAPALQPAPLRLLRLHLRARRLNAQESAAARALERSLPPGYQAALRPGQQSKPTNAITADADLRVEVCGTYRDGSRVKAFAGAAERCESKWRLTSFNFV